MSTGDPVCPHGWLANCTSCRRLQEVGINPWYPGFKTTQPIYEIGMDGPIGLEVDGIFAPMKKNHKPNVGPAILAEHQAQIEWDARTQTVAELKKTFLSLPIEFRREVLKDICMFCLRESRGPCYCSNDE